MKRNGQHKSDREMNDAATKTVAEIEKRLSARVKFIPRDPADATKFRERTQARKFSGTPTEYLKDVTATRRGTSL